MAGRRTGFIWIKLLFALAFILLVVAEMGFAVSKLNDAYLRCLNQTSTVSLHHHG
jgi:hypothetical protein